MQVYFYTLAGVWHAGYPYKLQEDGQDYLLILPCGGDLVGSNLQLENDRVGNHLLGRTEVKSSVP